MTSLEFKDLELADKAVFNYYLGQDPPTTSELTFTNLFMWRHHYRPSWAESNGCLLIVYRPESSAPFGLPPIGPGDKANAIENLFTALGGMSASPLISRAPASLVEKYLDFRRYAAEPNRDQSDYVYATRDLIELAGRKLHQKKNHLNQFLKSFSFETHEISAHCLDEVLQLQEEWCYLKRCEEHPDLAAEDLAIQEILSHHDELDYRGLVVLIDGKVEAFSLGEPLNPTCAVIHIEKANPDIRGLYVAVNQLACREFWSGFPHINREQDLGAPGLRKAKESWHPDHLVEKYNIRLLP